MHTNVWFVVRWFEKKPLFGVVLSAFTSSIYAALKSGPGPPLLQKAKVVNRLHC
jgi:hypothetical protein